MDKNTLKPSMLSLCCATNDAKQAEGVFEKMELRCLLSNLRKSIEMWFLSDEAEVSQRCWVSSNAVMVINNCLDILKHGLCDKLKPNDNNADTAELQIGRSALNKLIDDFKWLQQQSCLVHESPISGRRLSRSPLSPSSINKNAELYTNYSEFLCEWIVSNLKSHSLCACLQALLADNELLTQYYRPLAFLRHETYAMALCICVSALELNQFSLLSQIDEELYSPTIATACNVIGSHALNKLHKHKRSSSHPIFSILPVKSKTLSSTLANQQAVYNKNDKVDASQKPTFRKKLPTFRRVKSLPHINHQDCEPHTLRPRCKTLHESLRKSAKLRSSLFAHSAEIKLNQNQSPIKVPALEYIIDKTNPTCPAINMSSTLTTDVCHNNAQSLNFSICSSNSANSEALSVANQSEIQSNKSNLQQQHKRIQIIKCDDIKIWTDQSFEQQASSSTSSSLNVHDLSNKLPIPADKKLKNGSPLNSLLNTFFGSSPEKKSLWYISSSPTPSAAGGFAGFGAAMSGASSCSQYSNLVEQSSSSALRSSNNGGLSSNSIAAAAIYPCNKPSAQVNTNTSSVFDAFLPVYGQKLPLKPQNLFEEGITSLDYSRLDLSSHFSAPNSFAKAGEMCVENGEAVLKEIPKNCQSLTAFLQMAHLSRNNTQLEKENAHFRISEAIISAIEHIKWAKTEPDKWQTNKGRDHAEPATDWLEKEDQHNLPRNTEQLGDEASEIIDEHIPYAELGENCLDLLSAEVVGLSLISKFNDNQLPKVSELKWLVSEDDAPQKLLPLPDPNSSSNPDDNVMPSATRGTRYWAPPRQQIIFTDHPMPNRKEQIRNQNNRCAGCGMKVSPQLINSFRYCTYLGKYNCTGCHRNQISAIPAKILNNWDFKCYPVSVFAYRLLEQMYTFPLFYVPDLNPELYMRSKALLQARQKRLQLGYVKDFIKNCRFALNEQHIFAAIPDYISGDPDAWSLSDFIDAHSKSMHQFITNVIDTCEQHILNCELCNAHGFHCESCRKTDIIFPWQLKTFRCDRCGACFHLNCWKCLSENCCRCQRLNMRSSK